MFYFIKDYPAGPPSTRKGDVEIQYGGKTYKAKNVEVVVQPPSPTSKPKKSANSN